MGNVRSRSMRNVVGMLKMRKGARRGVMGRKGAVEGGGEQGGARMGGSSIQLVKERDCSIPKNSARPRAVGRQHLVRRMSSRHAGDRILLLVQVVLALRQ